MSDCLLFIHEPTVFSPLLTIYITFVVKNCKLICGHRFFFDDKYDNYLLYKSTPDKKCVRMQIILHICKGLFSKIQCLSLITYHKLYTYVHE